ncbi:ubiquitin carboxyl-terminal hydrolase 36-like isoform X2 [Lineus longissimus]|uniref:ubiquitin carboxyl-terminal hydrolase 36-like isoform X2 n=1 Tax=Lineus longissimus TaxID=88925 RepID=UPI00315D2B23
MPASSSDSVTPVEASLRASLGGKDSLDQQLAASSTKVLLQKIDFTPAQKSCSFEPDRIKAKYVLLNPSGAPSEAFDGKTRKKMNPGNTNGKTSSLIEKVPDDGIPPPKIVLFSKNVDMHWKAVRKVGAGLHNMGNTCFLNSTLQCLTYTAPLANYLMTDDHPQKCKVVGFCMMCELQRHMRRCFEKPGNAIRPQTILLKLNSIAKHMHWGRQEDAHEFLRYVVDSMQKSALIGYNKLDRISKETTVVNKVFGGFLRSQVTCLRCKEKSNTYDPCMDISLDIKNVPSIQKAFEKFVHPETLDCDNAYHCPRCKNKVSATKRFSVHRPPNALTIQLKRFDYNKSFGGKITRHIHFSDRLDIRPYMSVNHGEPVNYQLYGVLVHSGMGCTSGHYYCYVKSPSQVWHCMNDASVSQVGASRVFNSEAYLLFYNRMLPRKPQITDMPQKVTENGPRLPNNIFNPATSKSNGPLTHKANDMGIPVSRKPSATVTGPTKLIGPQKPPNAPTTIPLPNKRDKVSFGIRPIHSTPQSSSSHIESQKPRIVMHIKKNGHSYAVENKAEKIVNGIGKKGSGLVPYGEESSDSEHENRSTVVNHKKPEDKSKQFTKQTTESNVSEIMSPSLSKEKKSVEVSAKNFTRTNGPTISLKKNTVGGTSPEKKSFSGVTSPVYQSSSGGASPDKKSNGGTSPVKKSSGGTIPVKNSKSEPTLVPSRDLTAELKSSACLASLNLNSGSVSPTKAALSSAKTFGPLQRSISDSHLSVQTTLPAKINATTPWNVQFKDSAISPSLGSESSNTSINSTTGEWKVQDSGKAQEFGPHVAAGWTVTKNGGPLENGHVLPVSHKSSDNQSKKVQVERELPSDMEKPKLKPLILARRDKEEKEEKDPLTLHIFKKNGKKEKVNGDPFNHKDAKADSEIDKSSSEDKWTVKQKLLEEEAEQVHRSKKHKKHKKQKKHKKEISDFKYEKLDESTDTGHKKHKKKKKKKHKRKDNEKEEVPKFDSVHRHDDKDDAYHRHHDKVDGHKHHDVSYKHKYDSERLSDRNETDHRRCDKKDSEDRYDKNRDYGYKHHRKDDGDHRHHDKKLSSPDDHTFHKKKSEDNYGNEKSRKRSSPDDDYHKSESKKAKTDYRCELSGRSKEGHQLHEKEREKSRHAAPVQHWDQHVKEGYKRRHGQHEPVKSKSFWDGTRTYGVAEELEKQSSSRGYGGSVPSWDGGQSHLDQEVERDRKRDSKRAWADDYEDELDQGKAKKYKANISKSSSNLGDRPNIFQKFQDLRNETGDKIRFESPQSERDPYRSSKSHHSHHNHSSDHHRHNSQSRQYSSHQHRH